MVCTGILQCYGLRPWSYDKTGLRPVPVLVLVLQFRSWSWSCTSGFGLGLGLNILVLFPIVHLMRIKFTINHGVDPRAHALYLKVNEMLSPCMHGDCKHNRQVAEQQVLFYYLCT